MERAVIVGAGQAGLEVACGLRDGGFEGSVTLVGAEPLPPYQRPPLSKKYLLGEMDVDRLLLRPESFYAERDITLRLGIHVDAIDREAKVLRMADGDTLAYDRLALTTGAAPRRLPASVGGDLPGVYVLRSKADVDAIRPLAVSGARVLIVGGGFIGLEAAAVAAGLGLRVTLVEAADRILQRVAAPETADWFRAIHRARGVDLREGTGLARMTGTDRLAGAELSDGTRVEADFALVGVGVTPETGLAEAAGLGIENGIVVDEACRTSDPDIVAAGDCAALPWRGARIRLESVQNAVDQARAAARTMLGEAVDYDPVPWFWSDQYDAKLQIAGLNTGYDRVVARPGTREGAGSHWYYREGVFIAVDALNDPRAYMIGKRWLEQGANPPPDLVADGGVDLKKVRPPAAPPR